MEPIRENSLYKPLLNMMSGEVAVVCPEPRVQCIYGQEDFI